MPTPHSPEPVPSSGRLTSRDGWLLFAGALVLRAAAFRPGVPPAPPESLLAGAEPGGLLFALRLAAALAGSLAAVLAARAGARLAGRAGGLGAGWLLALTPFAVRNAAWVGAPSLLLPAGAGLLLFVIRWRQAGRPADLVGLGLWGALVLVGLRLAPLTSLADPDALSPLGAGLVVAARIAGPLVMLLALAGTIAAGRSRQAGAPAVAVATGILLLIVLLREGPDPNSLAAILPGIALLAAFAAARPRDIAPGLPAGSGRLALGVALVVAAGFSARAIAVSRSQSPARDAARWVDRHMPDGLPVLFDEPELQLRTPDPNRGGGGFHPVRIPPEEASDEEAPLFYDVDLARRFPLIVLRDAPTSGAPVRRGFQRFFREEWHQGFRTGDGEYPVAPVTVYARPEDWKPDSVKIAEVDAPLRSEALDAVRDTSQAYADWIVAAAKAMRAGGDVKEAQAFLDLAQKRGDWRAEVFFEQGLVQILTEHYDQAMSSMLDALDREPRHGGAHFNLGTLLEREGDLDGAETEYRAAIVNLDDPLPAHVRLGELLAKRGRMDEARAELDVVRRLRPGSQEQAILEQAIREAGGS